ncbi:hypothetical protein [Yinghuangia soli]|uniref:Uncharacterized protein n=1 Tax=Yinghuangia soli TaxID=2908204 RepID=A0AA41Q209_9ACTN|nr:hypothetical protein [Yinghuangia soli]MCF2528627.1 hypothetical protein [Yinghuangia soli]
MTAVQAAPAADTPDTPAAPGARDRRKLRNALRWTAAVAVFAAVAGGVTALTTLPDREKLPGLGTSPDGRHLYPALALPPIPDSPPGAPEDPGRRDYDIRALLLPKPQGAVPDPAFPGRGGWLPTEKFTALYQARTTVTAQLRDHGLRHIAASAWTTSDGMRTEVYLLHFDNSGIAEALFDELSSSRPQAVDGTLTDYELPPETDPAADLAFEGRMAAPDAAGRASRYVLMQNGDVVALVLSSAPAGVTRVPFDQAVALQGQLLR